MSASPDHGTTPGTGGASGTSPGGGRSASGPSAGAAGEAPIMLFSKNGSNHGGDLMTGKGDFAKIDVAWLNWWLKGDEGATGKGVLVGSTCTYCTDSGWEVKSMNIQ
jgi:hypothetical protein